MNDIDSKFAITEVELIYRNRTKASQRPIVRDSFAAYDLLRSSWDDNRIQLVEQFKIMLLDPRHNCLGISEISTGGISTCLVDSKILFATALKGKATGIILAHNHPSGDVVPSKNDAILTQRLVNAASILDMKITDHIILGVDRYYSMADDGTLPRCSL